ncbi:MAG TPA: 50S ribosomal protein L23 [Candidatus Paceibacterota bacterium]|nr:50S ribosomal protein L23 [Candidatus Paceibacterota bacterium]
MRFNIFSKNKKEKEKTPEPAGEVKVIKEEISAEQTWDKVAAGKFSAYRILKNAYVSEKASILGGLNQYIFKITDKATKQEIKKQIAALYNVKIRAVKILNMPQKRKDLGKHPGFRSGFRKAVVVLEPGQTIEQAKP